MFLYTPSGNTMLVPFHALRASPTDTVTGLGNKVAYNL